MRIFTHPVVFASVAAVLAACSSGGQNGATPIAPVVDSAQRSEQGAGIFRKLSIQPDAGTPAILINFVANGPNQGGVPCIDCVNGASTGDNIGMTGPSSYVLANTYWQYALSFTDIKYIGKCRLGWTITSGKTTIDSFGATINLTSSGGFVLYAIARPRPKYSGPATLTGRVVCGREKPSLQAPLYFQ
jgi:hypothetical protein